MLLPLRFPRLWLALGWLLVGLAIVACLLPGGVPGTQSWNDKTMHVIGYLALTTWFTGIYPRSHYGMIAFLLLTMGIVVEFVQGAMHAGRVAELRDVYADLFGIVIGLALARLMVGGWVSRVESWIAG